MWNDELKQKLKKVVVPVVVIAAIIFAGYFYFQARALKQSPQAVAQQEINDVVLKVSKLMTLPTGEEATVATVSDLAALKDQPFFASAQKGDKVLIYTQAKKVILYSVTLNKILDVAPLTFGASKAATSQTTPDIKTSTLKTP